MAGIEIIAAALVPMTALAVGAFAGGRFYGRNEERESTRFWRQNAADLSRRHDRMARAVGRMMRDWQFREWYRRNVEAE